MDGVINDIEGHDILAIAQDHGTPVSVNSERELRGQCRNLIKYIGAQDDGVAVRYAVKANTLGAHLRIADQEGIWFEIVSPGEGERVLRAEVAPEKIVYTSEDCSRQSLEWCIANDVLVNCRSLDMIDAYGSLNPSDKRIYVSINPGKGTGHHAKCSTGGPASKFGIWPTEIEDAKRLAADHGINIIGTHAHAGSGADIDVWMDIVGKMFEHSFRFKGLQAVNVGGGLPVPYKPQEKEMDIKGFGKALKEKFMAFCSVYGETPMLEIEPGRYIAAEAGYIISEVLAVKKTPDYNFVIVNTGFNHLIRPAMYGSFHPIWVYNAEGRDQVPVVVGDYLCESGGVFNQKDDGTVDPMMLPEMKAGDLVVIGVTGAYGNTMASNYNSRPKLKELLIDTNGGIHVIKEQETVDDMVRGENIPDHLRM